MGEFKDGEKHGQWTYTFSDEKKYLGEWKNGKYHGQGTFTSPDGQKYEGAWQDGTYSVSYTHQTLPTILLV